LLGFGVSGNVDVDMPVGYPGVVVVEDGHDVGVPPVGFELSGWDIDGLFHFLCIDDAARC
jgi:hypothetical protein